MADKTLNNVRILHRNDTAANWTTVNPVLMKGEIGIEIDTNKFKIGDGTKAWVELKYATSSSAVVNTKAPAPTDFGYDVGTIWIDSTSKKGYIIYDNTSNNAVWKQIVTPEELSNLGAGDMLKSQFANNGKVEQGYVDKAIMADEATVAGKLKTPVDIIVSGDVSGTASFDGSAAVDIATTVSNETIAGKAPAFTPAETRENIATGETIAVIFGKIAKWFGDLKALAFKDKVAMSDFDTDVSEKFTEIESSIDAIEGSITLDANKAVVTNGEGKLTASTVTAAEIGHLAGVTSPIQAQLDNIPKYNYKNGVEISIADGTEQDAINTAATAKLTETYPESVKWDAVTVNIVFTPSDVEKDALYYFNGTDWVFLNYISTGVQRANGETAGIVEDSDDITFNNGKGTVVQAGKVKNKLKIGAKEFDGSAPIEVTADDVGKAPSAAVADKVANVLTIQKNGADIDTFDGSVAKTVNIEVPTASTGLTDSDTLVRTTDGLIINCGNATL